MVIFAVFGVDVVDDDFRAVRSSRPWFPCRLPRGVISILRTGQGCRNHPPHPNYKQPKENEHKAEQRQHSQGRRR
jgi:hypothetical protein